MGDGTTILHPRPHSSTSDHLWRSGEARVTGRRRRWRTAPAPAHVAGPRRTPRPEPAVVWGPRRTPHPEPAVVWGPRRTSHPEPAVVWGPRRTPRPEPVVVWGPRRTPRPGTASAGWDCGGGSLGLASPAPDGPRPPAGGARAPAQTSPGGASAAPVNRPGRRSVRRSGWARSDRSYNSDACARVGASVWRMGDR